MPAIRVDVQLYRVAGGSPFGIEVRADARGHIVIGGAQQEQRGSIRGNGAIGRGSAVNGGGKIRAAGWIELERDAEGNPSAGGKSHNAYSVRGNAPFRGVSAH